MDTFRKGSHYDLKMTEIWVLKKTNYYIILMNLSKETLL